MRQNLISNAGKAFKASAVALAIVGMAGTAVADDKKITFKTPSAFGTNLPITGSTSVYFADVLKKVSGGMHAHAQEGRECAAVAPRHARRRRH